MLRARTLRLEIICEHGGCQSCMEWWMILLIALLCSLPAALLVWSALAAGKHSDDWPGEDDPPAQPIKTQTD
jgi:hypothetical protein